MAASDPNPHQGKLCKDCAHYVEAADREWMYATCALFTDPVEGSPRDCHILRAGEGESYLCGRSGHFWKDKDDIRPRIERIPDGGIRIIR